MKILVVTPFYEPAYVYGGPAQSAPAMCAGMTRLGAQVTVFTTDANGPGRRLDVPTDRAVEVDGVQVHYFRQIYFPLTPLFFYSPALALACRERIAQFDVVYCVTNWNHPEMVGARAALSTGVPYVIGPRGCFMAWSMQQLWWQKRLYLALVERRLMDGAAAIHCTTLMEQTQLKVWHFRAPSFVVLNGLEVSRFSPLPSRGALRQSLDIPPEATLSLFVGRLHKMKRIDLTLQAFARVVQSSPKAYLVIAGPDEDGSGKRAQEQAHALRLAGRVHFTGLLTGSALAQAYADADLLVLLSHRENFGMVVAEAMAAGLPVLISREVGLVEEVVPAGAGYAVSHDVNEIAPVWHRMLDSPAERRAMGTRARDLVERHFTAEVVTAQMLDQFMQIARVARPQPPGTHTQ
jgi:glycosyltransferase involved in cell wall biosynthesis